MSETSSSRLSCRDCGTEVFLKAPGQPPLRCDPCRTDWRRKTRRESARRNYESKVPDSLTCQECETKFPRTSFGGRPQSLCEPCKGLHQEASKARAAERTRKTQDAYDENGQRWSACHGCAAKLRCGPLGQLRRWCRPCRLKNARDYVRKPPREPYKCLDCDSLIAPGYNHLGALRCPPCGRVHARRVAKAWQAANWDRYIQNAKAAGHRRRVRIRGGEYEFFKANEIFERDGWRCGICQRRINRRVKYPHPMSPSIDHKLSINRGGGHTRANTQASHLRCNLRKNDHAAPIGAQIPLFI